MASRFDPLALEAGSAAEGAGLDGWFSELSLSEAEDAPSSESSVM